MSVAAPTKTGERASVAEFGTGEGGTDSQSAFTPEKNSVACVHCGTMFVPAGDRRDFCCAGCEYVHRLITGQNLDRFYQLRDRRTAPVRATVFQPRDYRWLEGLVQRAEKVASKAGAAALELDLQGISCVGCVWLIDRLFRDRPGALGIRINATLGRMSLRWKAGACDVVEFARELQRFGYLVGPASKAVRTESRALILRLGVCAAFALNGMLFSLPAYLGMGPDFPFAPLFLALSFFFATLSVLVGGSYFLVRSWRSLRRGVLHIDLPISLGICIGYLGSLYAWWQADGGFIYFDFVSTFTFLMLLGRWVQLAAVERNRNQLLGLQQDLPPVELELSADAFASDPGGGKPAVSTKPPQALDVGDRYRLEPGQIVPVSSRLLGPDASIGMDWINGESEARAILAGDVVESGAINLSPHHIRLEAVEPWAGSLLARLLAVEVSSEWRNLTLERVVRVYLSAVLLVALLGGVGWWWATGDVNRTLQVIVSVLVVSCPCAIGVTLPLIDELAVAKLRNLGVFIRAQDIWVRLQRVGRVVFDKTGTLTLESLTLENPQSLRALDHPGLRALSTLVRTSRHPVAGAVREALLASGLVDAERAGTAANPVREEVGFGLEWRDELGRAWRLGRASWAAAGHEDGEGGTVFSRDGVPLCVFCTREEVREDAAEEVARLRALGLEVFILSGDRPERVQAMADKLGLPAGAAIGSMTPDGKADWIRGQGGGDSLMIGDGANDSLAFDAAACRGTPAIERGLLEHKADFFFLGRSLSGVGRLLRAATLRRRVVKQVLVFAIVYNAVVVAVALAGLMSPLLAAVVMPASAVVSIAIASIGMRPV